MLNYAAYYNTVCFENIFSNLFVQKSSSSNRGRVQVVYSTGMRWNALFQCENAFGTKTDRWHCFVFAGLHVLLIRILKQYFRNGARQRECFICTMTSGVPIVHVQGEDHGSLETVRANPLALKHKNVLHVNARYGFCANNKVNIRHLVIDALLVVVRYPFPALKRIRHAALLIEDARSSGLEKLTDRRITDEALVAEFSDSARGSLQIVIQRVVQSVGVAVGWYANDDLLPRHSLRHPVLSGEIHVQSGQVTRFRATRKERGVQICDRKVPNVEVIVVRHQIYKVDVSEKKKFTTCGRCSRKKNISLLNSRL